MLARFKKMEELLRQAKDNGTFVYLPLGPNVINSSSNEVDKSHSGFKVLTICKDLIYERMSTELLNQDELLNLYNVLEKWSDISPFPISEATWDVIQKRMRGEDEWKYEKYISLKHYLLARNEMDQRFQNMLTARLYLTLRKDSDDKGLGRVPIVHIFNYVMKKIWLKQTQLGLLSYDEINSGYLKEDAFEAYIKDLIPTLDQLQHLDSDLEAYYLCVAARRFFFFLDFKKLGRIRILDALASLLIDEILELREPEGKEYNWFSIDNMLRIYHHYLVLDKDENGMLSPEEFSAYNYNGPFALPAASHHLTNAFVDRLFNEKMTYSGQIDFRVYVDFVLAMEHRKEAQSITFLFKILDMNERGYLDAFDLHYYYKDIQKILIQYGNDVPSFNDVKDEIFDMVNPANPNFITLTDLIKCGQGDVVLNMLIDAKGFDRYENREFLPQIFQGNCQRQTKIAVMPPDRPELQIPIALPIINV